MNRKIKALTVGSLALAMLTGAHVAFAQEKSRVTNIAVVDVQFVMENAAAAKNLRAQIEKIRANYQKEAKGSQDEVDKLRQSIVQERPKLSEDAYQQRMRELWRKGAKHQDDVQERQGKLDGALSEALRKIANAIEQVVDRIIKERKVAVVLPRSAFVGTPAVPDITQEVLKRLNQRIPSIAVEVPK